MNLKHFFTALTSLILLLFFIGCDEENGVEYQFPPADGRVIGNVHGIVQDSYSKQRIAGAEIRYGVNGEFKTVTSDSMGYYFISNLGSGEYEFTITVQGNYCMGKRVIYIPTITEIAGQNPSLKDYEISLVKDIELFKIDAGLSGKVYARDSENNLKPAGNVTVMVRFSQGYVEPSVYSTITDNEGNYIFDKSLPAAGYPYLYTMPFTMDGVEYDATGTSYINLIPGINVKADNMIAGVSASGVLLLTSPYNNNKFDPSANFEFVFSKSIDISSVNIELRRNDTYGTQLYFNTMWSDNNTVLTIDPFVILRQSTRYYIIMQGKSTDNSEFYFTGSVYTSGEDPIRRIRTNLEIIDGVYTTNFPVDGNIELEFNVTVDTSYSTYSITENNYPYNSVPFTFTLSSDEKIITLNPDDNLKNNFEYRLWYNIYSYTGSYTNGTINFRTENE